MKNLWNKWTGIALVKRIVVGLILGAILGVAAPGATSIAILGDVFVGALKAIAPLLVFFLVLSSLCNAGKSHGGVIKTVVALYMFSPLHVQHCTGSCDCRFRQHDFPCTADTYQCSRRRQCSTGYCGGPQQPSSEYCCQPGIFPGECKLCRYPYLGHPSWTCPSYSK